MILTDVWVGEIPNAQDHKLNKRRVHVNSLSSASVLDFGQLSVKVVLPATVKKSQKGIQMRLNQCLKSLPIHFFILSIIYLLW